MSFMEMFKYEYFFSIVTVTYNCENKIENTINSILNQSFNDYQHIIIDGGSSDRTLEIVKSLIKNKLNYVLHSGPDQGIYDAMNKSFKFIFTKTNGKTFDNLSVYSE